RAVEPGIDAKGALGEGLLDPKRPQRRAGAGVFGASQRRRGSGGPSAWGGPSARPPGAPYWTDTYALVASGARGVSGFIPLHGGLGMVGVDVALSSLMTASL